MEISGKYRALAGVLLAAAFLPVVAYAQDAPAAGDIPEAIASRTCGATASIVYQPPLDLIRLVARRMTAEGRAYRRDVVIVVTVGEDGLVREVQLERSSGHRLMDVAIRNWATGKLYAPQECGTVDRYQLRQKVVVEGGTDG